MANLSSDSLKALSHSLFSVLQGNNWKWDPWQEFCEEVESLTGSIAQYVDYLDRQNKKMTLKLITDTITDTITVTYVEATTSSTFPLFQEVDATLEGMQKYEYVFLNDLLPDEEVQLFAELAEDWYPVSDYCVYSFPWKECRKHAFRLASTNSRSDREDL